VLEPPAAPYTRLGALVEAVAEVLAPQLDRPFAFFGHSMGAMISFELTRLLRRRHGLRPAHLFLSGRRAPQFPPTEPPTYHLPEPEFVEKLRGLNGTPAEVLAHAELMQLLIPLLRADFEVVQTYEYAPGPPLDCPVSVYGGLLDAEVSDEHLKAWGELAAGEFELRMFPGDHFFIQSHEQQIVRAVGERLSRLARVAA
jgi:medium-chain acyl-[acyl-carrier-protein] hydrolase